MTCCTDTCTVNCKRVLLGGLAAGLWLNLVEFLAHGLLLMDRYTALTKMGFFHSEPKLPYMAINPLLMFGVGILIAWLYATSRDTLTPGPKTALKIGVALWFIAIVPGAVAEAAWCATGKFIPFVRFLTGFFDFAIAALIAGAIYKPRPSVTA